MYALALEKNVEIDMLSIPHLGERSVEELHVF